MSLRKISATRRIDYAGRSRRSVPPVNRLKRERQEALERELKLIAALMRDAKIRRSFEIGAGVPREPMSVWTENDQTAPHTELAPTHLPEWEDITEFMKMFLGFDIGMEFRSAYSFTAHIVPSILDRCDRPPSSGPA